MFYSGKLIFPSLAQMPGWPGPVKEFPSIFYYETIWTNYNKFLAETLCSSSNNRFFLNTRAKMNKPG